MGTVIGAIGIRARAFGKHIDRPASDGLTRIAFPSWIML
jgi:hypothetical protein